MLCSSLIFMNIHEARDFSNERMNTNEGSKLDYAQKEFSVRHYGSLFFSDIHTPISYGFLSVHRRQAHHISLERADNSEFNDM